MGSEMCIRDSYNADLHTTTFELIHNAFPYSLYSASGNYNFISKTHFILQNNQLNLQNNYPIYTTYHIFKLSTQLSEFLQVDMFPLSYFI